MLYTKPKRTLFLLFMTFSVFGFYSLPSQLMAGQNSLKIKIARIVDGEKKTVEKVHCVIIRIGTQRVKRGKTNIEGKCIFEDLSQGKYMLYFGSSKFKNKYRKWALPCQRGPIKIKRGANIFEIISKLASRVRGKIQYTGDIKLSDANISSKNSQFDVNPEKNGKFLLRGLVSNENPEIHILFVPSPQDNIEYTPAYKKIINVKPDNINPGEVFDVGEVEFPKAKKSEGVSILFLDKDGNHHLTASRLDGLSHTLLMKNKENSIILNAGSATLTLKKNKSSGDGAKFRLPEGEYTAWWRGYKENTSTSFRITQEKTPKIKMRLPDEQE